MGASPVDWASQPPGRCRRGRTDPCSGRCLLNVVPAQHAAEVGAIAAPIAPSNHPVVSTATPALIRSPSGAARAELARAPRLFSADAHSVAAEDPPRGRARRRRRWSGARPGSRLRLQDAAAPGRRGRRRARVVGQVVLGGPGVGLRGAGVLGGPGADPVEVLRAREVLALTCGPAAHQEQRGPSASGASRRGPTAGLPRGTSRRRRLRRSGTRILGTPVWPGEAAAVENRAGGDHDRVGVRVAGPVTTWCGRLPCTCSTRALGDQ